MSLFRVHPITFSNRFLVSVFPVLPVYASITDSITMAL